MDVEIVKQNGQSFRLSDYGVVQDFVVHSIDRSVVRDPIEGRAGLQDYGVEIGDRTIEVPMIFKAADLHDYAHLRDELYGLLDDSEPFYIREMRRPKSLQYDFVDFGQKPKWEAQTDNEYVNGKQYKVRLNSTLTPEQRSLSGEVSIEFVTSGLPYAESIYTTLELHDSGYSATAEKYGLVDNIDDEKVKYRFTPDLVYTDLTSNSFEQGSIFFSNGQNADSNTQLGRLKNHYSVIKGQNYQLNLSETGGTIKYIRIFHYDSSGNLIRNDDSTSNVNGNGSTSLNFVASGTSIRLLIYAVGSVQVNVSGIGTLTKIVLSSVSTKSEFNVYNAGNVTVEPESMLLHIFVTSATGDSITIKNNTTGETFTLNRKMAARHIQVNGMIVTDGTTQVFRDTNKRFISLAPGDNNITVTGATFSEIRFNFKCLYK